jgi:hypothetical protein
MDGDAPGDIGLAGAGLGDAGLRDDRAVEGGVDAAEALRAVIAETGAVVAGAAGCALPGVEIFAVLGEVNPESTESVLGMRSS